MKMVIEELNGFCVSGEDSVHCEHWWDGEKCCSCGDPAMTYEEMLEQGMITATEAGRMKP